MHNGQVGEFERVRRALTLAIETELFSNLRGNTDSELLFYLMIGHGLFDDPRAAIAKTVALVEIWRNHLEHIGRKFLGLALSKDIRVGHCSCN